MSTDTIIAAGRRVLDIEIEAMAQLRDALGEDFAKAVAHLKASKGRVILAGVGKSGHVARKISATLASTGTPSLYVHPTEASHGDMGMITPDDTVIALSRSGETQELADMIGYCARFNVPLMAITAQPHSTLAKAAKFPLIIPDAPEACAETRAPTTSTTLQIAMGDALSVALLEAKGFTAKDFKAFHPGGALGASLATVADLMHTGDAVPLVDAATPMSEALITMSEKGFGCVGVLNGDEFCGIITDGDLRRHMDGNLTTKTARTIMTASPKTAQAGDLAGDALRRMTAEPPKVMQLFVLDGARAVGILHLHDCLRAGLA
ncbi:KpsF/GutQ family sugar-phosphate isomerase [Robiginitomaculum antarcticum]|uniref:KpsF/GutQ family sugar-phosphate isomerase n=1 Tax=Robiginitomaculum antarcticum TaxID=437507 RepID=UPI000370E24B|nr:KpsF/GutQ family sugar-phosphate isomerase [Robiginitomaculum antarcticum]